MLLGHCYAFCLSLYPSGLKNKFLEEEIPVTYFGPALDQPLDGSGRKTTTLVRDHEYFIPIIKINKSVLEKESKMSKVYDGRTAGRTTDGAL